MWESERVNNAMLFKLQVRARHPEEARQKEKATVSWLPQVGEFASVPPLRRPAHQLEQHPAQPKFLKPGVFESQQSRHAGRLPRHKQRLDSVVWFNQRNAYETNDKQPLLPQLFDEPELLCNIWTVWRNTNPLYKHSFSAKRFQFLTTRLKIKMLEKRESLMSMKNCINLLSVIFILYKWA